VGANYANLVHTECVSDQRFRRFGRIPFTLMIGRYAVSDFHDPVRSWRALEAARPHDDAGGSMHYGEA
jgi:hypothetical protein